MDTRTDREVFIGEARRLVLAEFWLADEELNGELSHVAGMHTQIEARVTRMLEHAWDQVQSGLGGGILGTLLPIAMIKLRKASAKD